ncbi:MAG: hypothetical protein IT168_13065 [Bryobacterales bacterium]|nr:hypothetical protein [Bryobacterales bacterium]
MLRAIVYIVVSIFLITLLRGIIGIITKGVGQLFEGETNTAATKPGSAPQGGFGGELMKCSVCGTFASPVASLTLQRDGNTYHFCSQGCRAKFT